MLTGAQLVAKCLANEGVEVTFGMCGHTNLALLDALRYETNIRFISVRHEQVAAHAADGYSRVTHKPGVLILHVGPGMTNAVTGVVTAAQDSTPMVVIAGDIQSYYFGRDPHQEVKMHIDASQYEIYRPFVKRAWRVNDVSQFPDILARAFNIATSGRPGPVLIDVPMDIYSETAPEGVSLDVTRKVTGRRIAGDQAEVSRAVKMLAEAERPLIYAGGGVIMSEAWSQLAELAEYLAIPVATSLMGKGAIPEDHPLSVGMTGVYGTPVANELTRTADVILAVGTRFTEFDTSSWNPKYCFAIPPARLIHVDIDNEEIGKTYPVEVGIQGDARAVLEQMAEAAKDTTKRKDLATDPRVREIRSRMAAWYAAVEPNQRAKSSPIRPERILREVREILSPEDIIVTDTGWNKNGVGNQFPIYRPMTHLAPGGFATMGFGTAAVIGAKIGRPDRVALALIGDGAFSSVTPALATAVESGVSPIWVVMNNYSYGVITGLQRRNFKRTAWTEFVREESGEAYNPDFAALARAYGVEGVKVEDPEEFKPALEKAVKSGQPYVLDVIMDKEATIPVGGLWDVNTVLEKGARR